MSDEKLVRIIAPHFVAGVVFVSRRVVRCAPIVGYMHGWSAERVHGYIVGKQWEAHRVTSSLRPAGTHAHERTVDREGDCAD